MTPRSASIATEDTPATAVSASPEEASEAAAPETLGQCFLSAVDRHANPRAQMYRDASGWHAIPATEMLRRAAGLADALAALGIQPGDRVGLFAPNCPEWHISDFAIQGLGAVTVPVYFNESADRLIYILQHAGARIVVTSGASQAKKMAECRANLGGVEHVISASAPPEVAAKALRFDDLVAPAGEVEVAEYRRRAAEVKPEQLATIIYTSGTTGEPKGVMLSHRNLASNAIDSRVDFDVLPGDIGLSLLPLAHVYGRIIDYGYFFKGITVAYVDPIEMAAQALLEVHPTIMAAVPRLYEKMYAGIVERGHKEKGIKRRLFDWALGVAARAVPWKCRGEAPTKSLEWRWKVADRIVFSKIRAGIGGRIRSLSSGGAPISRELIEFFWSIDLPVYQGYGLTETSPVVSTNSPKANKIGTVGKPIAEVEVKIAEDGEILVKGKCVMQGYYQKLDSTREAFTSDGWLCTGDIGALDEDGYLTITDRKKELLKTAGGKFVAPAPIENLLKSSPYIDNAMVIGDRRKFASVLIVPNFAHVEEAARKDGKELAPLERAIFDPWVLGLISQEIERLTAPLAHYEKPKRFALIEKDFSYANGELTYTLKLKRRVIEEHYKDVIEKIYADVEEPKPPASGAA